VGLDAAAVTTGTGSYRTFDDAAKVDETTFPG
jgi:hypothetical protein